MSKTHWKKLVNPEYLGAYDFEPGEERTLTIQSVISERVKNSDGKEEECIVCRFTSGKPMILNRTNSKTIAKVYDSPYIEDWSGKAVTLYVTRVKAFGEMVEALRIRAMKPEPPKKETLTADRFNKMVEAIKDGKFDLERARTTYSLTADQRKTLDAL